MESLSQKIEAYFEQNKRTLIIVVCVLAVLIVGATVFTLVNGRGDQASVKAWELLDESYISYLGMEEPAEGLDEPTKAQVRTDLIEKYVALSAADSFVSLQKDFTLGMLYFDDAKYGDAATYFEKVVARGDSIFYATALMNQAASLESAGKIDETIALYESVLAKESRVGLSHGQVQLELARIFAQNGRVAEAKELYQKLADSDEVVSLKDHAKTMLFRLGD